MAEGDPVDSIDEDGSNYEISGVDSDGDSSDDFLDENAQLSEDSDDSSDSSGIEEEDSLISAIENRKEVQQTKPSPIKSDDLFTDISFHPSCEIIAMSCLSGNIEIHSYSIEENVLKGSIEAHTKSCRAIEFSTDGRTLYSVGQDKNVIYSDIETLDITMFINKAHHGPLTALCVPDEHVLVTGCEEGVMKMWDTRDTKYTVLKAHDAQDYISCITCKDSYKIACSSGDGTLGTYDLRAKRRLHYSAPIKSDLTCCTSAHYDRQVVCGSMMGKYIFFNWEDASEPSGTYKPRVKSPINCVLQVSDNLVLSGCQDGNIRAYHFFPHKLVGLVGHHTLTVEKLDVSHDGALVASLSPDPIVKFWDISYLEGFDVTSAEKCKGEDAANLPSSEFDDRKSFFSDLL